MQAGLPTEIRTAKGMAARVVEITQAVADYISDPARAYPYSFQTHRVNYGISQQEGDALTHIFVYPSTYMPGPDRTRETFSRTFAINLDIVNYTDSFDDQEEIDNALDLAEKLETSLENVDMAEASFMEFGDVNSGRNLFEVESQVDRQTFHVVIPLVYRGALR